MTRRKADVQEVLQLISEITTLVEAESHISNGPKGFEDIHAAPFHTQLLKLTRI